MPSVSIYDKVVRSGVHNTTLRDKVCQRLVAGQWFSQDTMVSFTKILKSVMIY